MVVKHSILVPAYNHEKYIGEALDSIVSQSVKPFEVFVVDDCSTDRTEEVVKEYLNKYKFIKYIRHNNNLGLIENLHFIKGLPTGDVVSWCAGDDLLKEDLILNLNRVISKEKIILKSNFLLITNSEHLYADGSKSFWDNYAERENGVFWMRLRQGLSYRGVGFSMKLHELGLSDKEIRKTNIVDYNCIDIFKGFDQIDKAEQIVFCDFVGGIYRVHVGVSHRKDELRMYESMVDSFKLLKKLYKSRWSEDDFIYIDLQIKYWKALTGHQSKLKVFFELWRRKKLFSINNDAFKNMARLFPSDIMSILKSIYPIYIRLRTRN